MSAYTMQEIDSILMDDDTLTVMAFADGEAGDGDDDEWDDEEGLDDEALDDDEEEGDDEEDM